jgi:hypothetical protein
MKAQTKSLADSIAAVISTQDKPTRDRCDRTPTAEMIKAFDQFNRGEYWVQHETLENVWRAETDSSIRNFYKGIIQVGVGFHHLTKRNYNGVMKVLARGINYLKPYAPECYGVDVARLIEEGSAVYLRAKDLGPERLDEIPLATLPKVYFQMSKNE